MLHQNLNVSIFGEAVFFQAQHLVSIFYRSDWTSLNLDVFDIEIGLDTFTVNQLPVTNELAPVKTVKQVKSKRPWIEDEICYISGKRESTYRWHESTDYTKDYMKGKTRY